MPYTIEDFQKDYVREHIHRLSPEERLEGLPADERLKGIPADERLKGLSRDEIFSVLKQQFSSLTEKEIGEMLTRLKSEE